MSVADLTPDSELIIEAKSDGANYHKLKLLVDFADVVASGAKSFEIRKNDRGYQRGDFIQFNTVDIDGEPAAIDRPVNTMMFEITYVLSGWGIKDGYVVFGIRRVL
ncbi:DUF3850 domain-containing protein [Lachnospiraceae bacterium OttesenSCG-928-J05]|nr:DUF3850 domain-containing protein [Lachnospiraceae bacterium OttesenSCG-928-J05]